MAISGSSGLGFRGHVRRLRRMRRRARIHTMAGFAATRSTSISEEQDGQAHFLIRQIRKQAQQPIVHRAATFAS